MMERIAVVDGAYSSGNVSDIYAAIAYEKLEDRAGASFRPTVYDAITQVAMRLRQPGARDRGATGVREAQNFLEAVDGTDQGTDLLNSFNGSGFTNTYYSTLEEARKDPKWSAFEQAMKPKSI